MSESALKAAYERASTLPKEVQEQLAGMLNEMVDQHTSDLHLNPEQVEEVRRRLADPNPMYVEQEQVFAEVRKFLKEDSAGYSDRESALWDACEKVLTLPDSDQADAVDLLEDFVAQRSSDLHLSPEQVEELREILADPNPEYVDQEEVFAEIEKMLAEK